jgi:hypothetical protein
LIGTFPSSYAPCDRPVCGYLNFQRIAGSSFKLFQNQKIASFGFLKKTKEPTSSGHFKNFKNQLSMKRTNTIWWWYGWLFGFSKF